MRRSSLKWQRGAHRQDRLPYNNSSSQYSRCVYKDLINGFVIWYICWVQVCFFFHSSLLSCFHLYTCFSQWDCLDFIAEHTLGLTVVEWSVEFQTLSKMRKPPPLPLISTVASYIFSFFGGTGLREQKIPVKLPRHRSIHQKSMNQKSSGNCPFGAVASIDSLKSPIKLFATLEAIRVSMSVPCTGRWKPSSRSMMC